MPNYTIKVKKTKVSIEAKDLKAAEKRAKDMGGKIIHKGNDHGDDENHPNIVRDKRLAEQGKKAKSNDEEE